MRYTLGLHFFTIAKYLLRFKHPPYPLMTTIYLTPLAMSQNIPWKLGPNESNIQPTASVLGSPPCTKLLLINPPTLLVSLRFFSWDSTVCPIKTSPHQTEGYGANFANSNACILRKASTTHLCTEHDLSAWTGQRSKDTCSSESNIHGNCQKSQPNSGITEEWHHRGSSRKHNGGRNTPSTNHRKSE